MEEYWDGPVPNPDVRTVDGMRAVLADPDCTASAPLYFMYRNLARNKDDQIWLSGHDLRYDITVIPPCTLCGEYVKTKGHYHPDAPGGYGYPELYQVLAGSAHFLLQKKDLSDIVVISADQGDVVPVPPGYGHVTINPSDKKLVMANLVSQAFLSEYTFYEKMHGAAYYEMEGENWVKNVNYPPVPALRFIAADDIPNLRTEHGKPIYDLIGTEGKLDFLNYPEKFTEMSGLP